MNMESLRTTPVQRNYIKGLFAKHGNSLTSDQLVQAAEAQNSPIHELFTWNNRRAAHLYRLRQAARILRSYTGWLPEVMKKHAKGAPNLVANREPFAVKIRRHPEEDKRWVQTANALENKYMRDQLIFDRIDRVKAALDQLVVVPELLDLREQLTKIINSYMKNLVNGTADNLKGVSAKRVDYVRK